VTDRAHDTSPETLANRLRDLRRRHGLSAREVAARAGVTPAYLSRLENGKLSPTVSTLSRVVQAMGESVAALFDGDESGPLVRRDERRLVRNRGVDDYLLTPRRAQRLELLETYVEPGGSSGSSAYTHPGDEECILVLESVLTVWLDGKRYDLREGDALTFPCRTPHRWENPSDRTTRALWIVTPPTY
jgi:transcriptional regulator with XRE-family HTH domain